MELKTSYLYQVAFCPFLTISHMGGGSLRPKSRLTPFKTPLIQLKAILQCTGDHKKDLFTLECPAFILFLFYLHHLPIWSKENQVWEGGTLFNKNKKFSLFTYWKYNKLPILYFLTQGTLWKTNQTFCPVYHTIIWQLNQSPGQVTVSMD